MWGKVRGQQGMSLEPCASEAALLTPVMQAYSLLWYPRRGQLWWEVGLVSSQLSKGYRLPKAASEEYLRLVPTNKEPALPGKEVSAQASSNHTQTTVRQTHTHTLTHSLALSRRDRPSALWPLPRLLFWPGSCILGVL